MGAAAVAVFSRSSLEPTILAVTAASRSARSRSRSEAAFSRRSSSSSRAATASSLRRTSSSRCRSSRCCDERLRVIWCSRIRTSALRPCCRTCGSRSKSSTDGRFSCCSQPSIHRHTPADIVIMIRLDRERNNSICKRRHVQRNDDSREFTHAHPLAASTESPGANHLSTASGCGRISPR